MPDATPTLHQSHPSSAAPPDVATIALPRRLVTATRADWRDAVVAHASAAVRRLASHEGAVVTLDLKETREVDVSGLGVLVVVRQRAHDRGVRVRLLHVSPEIRELLHMTRLEALFDFGE